MMAGRRLRPWAAAVFGIAGWAAQASAADAPQFALPLVCDPRLTCFIQNYVDLDSGPGARDFACGAATYDGHSGVDFRVLSASVTALGVPVLAAADGVVKGQRDGVADIFMRDNKAAGFKGRECGNGVLIDHGGGWQTQYCHLKQGSVGVSNGQTVKQGDRLGDVGYSGMADFAHVHFSVRKDDKVIDPFLPDAADGACRKDARISGLWRPEIAAKFGYQSGEIIGAGFAGAAPGLDRLEADHTDVPPATASAPALVFYGRFINLLGGDRIRIMIDGPGGSFTEELTQPLERNKATYLTFAGKRRKEQPWPPGRYEGRVEIVRDSAVIAARAAEGPRPRSAGSQGLRPR
jgi:hypothetical protein